MYLVFSYFNFKIIVFSNCFARKLDTRKRYLHQCLIATRPDTCVCSTSLNKWPREVLKSGTSENHTCYYFGRFTSKLIVSEFLMKQCRIQRRVQRLKMKNNTRFFVGYWLTAVAWENVLKLVSFMNNCFEIIVIHLNLQNQVQNLKVYYFTRNIRNDTPRATQVIYDSVVSPQLSMLHLT